MSGRVSAIGLERGGPPQSRSAGRWRGRWRGRGVLIAGFGVVGLLVFAGVFATVLAPFDPTAISREGLRPPSWANLLGTDELGRDILSRLIYAARVSLLVALGSV